MATAYDGIHVYCCWAFAFDIVGTDSYRFGGSGWKWERRTFSTSSECVLVGGEVHL